MVRVIGPFVRQSRSRDIPLEGPNLGAILATTELIRHGLDASSQLLRLTSQTINTLLDNQPLPLLPVEIVPLTVKTLVVFVQLLVDVGVVLVVHVVELVEPLQQLPEFVLDTLELLA